MPVGTGAPGGAAGPPPGPRAPGLLVLAGAALWAVVLWTHLEHALAGVAGSAQADYLILLRSAEALREGASPYAWFEVAEGDSTRQLHPNLNHPAVVVLMQPLAALPAGLGVHLWNGLGVLAAVGAGALALREVCPRPGRRAVALAALLAAVSPGVIWGLQLGQIALLLTLPLAVGWLLLRRGRDRAAGVLLGVLVALKPFLVPLLLLFLVPGRRRGVPAVAAGGLGTCLAAFPWVGLAGYREWLGVLGQVDWFEHPFNASLTGVAFRAAGSALPDWFAWLPQLGLLGLAALVLTQAPPPGVRRRDRDLAVLLLAALLGSPLGWLYYTPLLLPVVAVLWGAWPASGRGRRALVATAGVLLLLPYNMPLPLAWVGHVADAVADPTTYGMLLVLLVLCAGGARPAQVEQRPPATEPGSAARSAEPEAVGASR